MRLEPSFADHWKTQLLVSRCGAEAVLCWLRLLGAVQISRKWFDLDLSPKKLAMKTKWFGDENQLWQAFTDKEAPWIDQQEDGLWRIHDFELHNRQVIHLWNVGQSGGRPKKEKDQKKEEEKNTLSLSLNPNGYPNENHLVSDTHSNGFPTLDDVKAYGRSTAVPISEKCAVAYFDSMEACGWIDAKQRPIKNWRASFRYYASHWNEFERAKGNKPEAPKDKPKKYIYHT